MSATLMVPQWSRPGSSSMADLAAEERHRFRGLDRNPHHRPGGAVDPARQVDRIARAAPRSSPRSSRARGLRPAGRGRPRTAHRRRRRPASSAARRRGARRARVHRWAASGGIALEPLAVADQQQPDPVPAFGQQARRDEAVAAVVARPGHDGDARARAGAAPRRRRRPPGRRSPSARCRQRRRRSPGGPPRPSRRW